MLAAAQASPPSRAALDRVVGEVWPGSRAERVEPLTGGLGSVLHRIDLVGAPVASVVLRQLLVEFGDDADTVRREAEVHRAGAAAGVAMPVVHWSDPEGSALGRPALLLEHVPGHPILADLATATGQAAMAATLHAVAGVPTQTLAHVPRLATLEDVVTRFWPPPVTSEVVDAAALNAAVDAAVGAFEPGDALLHMDLHGGNVLWDGATVTGVLDCPGAAVGTSLFDEAYCWFDTCLAHGREVADALQAAVDATRPGEQPGEDVVHLWRGVALQRGLPSPGEWTEAYVACGVDVEESTVEARFVALVDEYLGKG